MDVERIRATRKQLIDAVTLLQANRAVLIPNTVMEIKDSILAIANDTAKKYPYISSRLQVLRGKLFLLVPPGYSIECTTFGQIVELFDFLIYEAETPERDIWNLIHPRIINVSQSLYHDGHYINAATDAFIEINGRLKNIFTIIAPDSPVPDGVSLMTTLFSVDKPLIRLCDINNQTGKDKQKGLMNMLQGAISALRNPPSHSKKENATSEEAMRRLMFASLLMYQIDEAVTYSNITE